MTIVFAACFAGLYFLRTAIGFPWPATIDLH
jgi:hypothetical protein